MNTELQVELRARDDFLHMSEEDFNQHNRTVSHLEQQIIEKDNVIRYAITPDKAFSSVRSITSKG